MAQRVFESRRAEYRSSLDILEDETVAQEVLSRSTHHAHPPATKTVSLGGAPSENTPLQRSAATGGSDDSSSSANHSNGRGKKELGLAR